MSNKNQSEKIVLSKKSVSIILSVIVTIIVLILLTTSYLPNQKQADLVVEYKKALYESVLCQYSCPIIEGEFNNETTRIPDMACIQDCVNEFRAKGIDANTISNRDLETDNFVLDSTTIIEDCRTLNLGVGANSTNSEFFFICAKDSLQKLNQTYLYLT